MEWSGVAGVFELFSGTQLGVSHLQDVRALSMATGPTRLIPTDKNGFF